jgi:AcrR family transcriptional regulator
MEELATPPGRGRARDPAIDARVLAVAATQLAARGFEAMSVAGIADTAGTTRQAIYRRWPTKSDLAAAAIGGDDTVDHDASADSNEPFVELVAELTDFRRGVSKPGRLSLVGSMLQTSADRDVATRYRDRVVAPRRRRLQAIFERAQQLGQIDANADLAVLVTMCTGSWYARALAGDSPPRNWPRRTSELAWRAAGGVVPGRVEPRLR